MRKKRTPTPINLKVYSGRNGPPVEPRYGYILAINMVAPIDSAIQFCRTRSTSFVIGCGWDSQSIWDPSIDQNYLKNREIPWIFTLFNFNSASYY